MTAVVTGATGAIGGAIAARVIEAGASTFLPCRSKEALQDVVEQSGWDTASVHCYTVDLATRTDVEAFARVVVGATEGVDILVHAAGTLALNNVETARLDDFDRQYHINVRAPFQLTQALIPALRMRAGQVVFINSSAGINAKSGGAQYAATKHALRALADSLRQEVNESGIRVMSVYVGRTASRLQAAVHEHERREYRPRLLLQPEDVAVMVFESLRLPRTAEVTDLHIRPFQRS
jgi:NADP-dependent 3-hydroxy acid dehydrogenase YdfG